MTDNEGPELSEGADVDAATLSILTTVVGNVATSAVMGAGRMLGRASAEQSVDRGPEVTLTDDGSVIIQLADANRLVAVMEGPYVSALTEAYVFARILAPVHGDAPAELAFIEEVRDDFKRHLSRVDELGASAAAIEYLWVNLTEYLDSVVMASEIHDLLDPDELNRLARMDVHGKLDQESIKAPRFLRDLASILRDPTRLERAYSFGSDINAHYVQVHTDMRLEHTLESAPREGTARLLFDSIYISRAVRTAEGETIQTDVALDLTRRGRFVITGAPGAGKSTLMQHVVRQVATEDGVRVPLLVRIREFSSDRPVLIDEIVAAIRRDLQMHDVGVDEIEAMLTLGRATVLFDGLDEALDLPRRRIVTAAIDAFSHRFPLTSVIVTSRVVGYEQAALSAAFKVLALLDFTDTQIMEYARIWFRQNLSYEGDVEVFYGELDTIPDLRSNPLMLSLICALYRARGHVPRNRRQVYAECADLLFNRWDPMRRITQPVDQVQHGQDLMQEIALWYFKSASAQAGVEQRQLEAVVQHFFVDTAGVLPSEARRRAASFIDYCSGRAWLLTWVTMNENGEKLYTFTHRTFMEYFAAEGLARSSADTDVLVHHVLNAYRENGSSVVPELVVQSAEYARRGQGRAVIRGIEAYERKLGRRHVGTYLALRVRLAGVLTLPASFIEPLFKECLEALASQSADTYGVLLEMMRLPRDQRNRLVAHLAGDPEIETPLGEESVRRRWAADFLERWAQVVLRRDANTSESQEWVPQLTDLWQLLREEPGFAPGPVSRLYFWKEGFDSNSLEGDELGAYLSLGRGMRTRSKVLFAVHELAQRDNEGHPGRAEILAQLPNVSQAERFGFDDGMDYFRELDEFRRIVDPSGWSVSIRRGIGVLAMVVFESASDLAEQAAVALANLAGFDLVVAAAGRRPGVANRTGLVEAARGEMRRFGLPRWADEWASGRVHLIAVEHDEFDDEMSF
ncbi:NACHT domain-containing protein [Cellulomonas cellasea]|uniref:NACHT domain-containing protein n=1 Tax=Cellulomonas cellasea TaxID=43670 RepID=UPI0025A4A2F5|nr:NACHT domain-containing protein [Cellulomonas cellasea]MDM8084110.1 NACHT domain-containing protein [Cellulomonas cellasea]